MARSRNEIWIGSAATFCFALTLRLIFLVNAGDAGWPHSTYFEGDAPLFAQWAAALDRGEAFEQGLPLHSPVIAHAMKWLLTAGSVQGLPSPARNFHYLKVAWCILSALTCAMLFYTVARRTSVRTGLIAGSLLAVGFGNYITATSLNGECLYALCLVAVVLLTQVWIERPSLIGAMGLGLLHGICMLLRAEHPLLLVFLVLQMLVAQRRTQAESSQDRSKSPSVAFPPGRLPRLAVVAGMTLVSVAVCMPWILRSASAVHRMNTLESSPIDFAKSPVIWSDSARELLHSLPAFARNDNFEFISASLAARGLKTIEASDVRQFLHDQFSYVPEAMSRLVFISSQGPLAFALANHPRADGGFSKVALDTRFGADPPLQLSLPSHLRLYNRGYAVGWEWIRENPGDWGRLVLKKLDRFWGGATLGFTALNWPDGRGGVREATDIATTAARKFWWEALWAGLLIVGAALAVTRFDGRIWLIVILYKLVVTAAFFGYARQAVSISPAFFVLAAIALDAALRRLPSGIAWRRAGWTFVGLAAIAVIVIDWYAAKTPAEVRVRGPVQIAPQWGAGAFECSKRVELILAP